MWHHGLALAIYCKAGAVTWTEKGTRRPFSANQTTLAFFFKAHPNSVSNAMNYLRKNGWLIPHKENGQVVEGEYKWVSHSEWAKSHPSLCIPRKLNAPPIIDAQPEEAA
jgi:hypothetical protein